MKLARLPTTISNEEALDDILSTPSPELIEMMKRLDGDLVVLGIAGKMGVNLGQMAIRAIGAAGVSKRVIGVARFSEAGSRAKLDKMGLETIVCDLADRAAVDALPGVKNVIFMAGRKFGTVGSEDETWAANTIVPANVAVRFKESRIVAYSTGCVYALIPPGSSGSLESDRPEPVGEYAQSALGRERVFQYFSKKDRTPVCLVRLNYANELRYGLLREIGERVYQGEPVDVSVPAVNVIWQGDAIAWSLLCLEQCAVPPAILNVTGPECASVRGIANEFAARFSRQALFSGQEGDAAYLSNATRAIELFGKPRVTLPTMLDWTADWIARGGRSLNKPTHFQTKDGKF
ncbi:MAG: NAD(P)-dependent oxidoreductase [Kiritimatiellae bacterium]|nr:NAD(P)-dependent oxidoreductase [Kiritimatiellia bacterium]